MAFRRTVEKRATTMLSSLAFRPQFHLFSRKTIIISSSNLKLPKKESNPTHHNSNKNPPLKSNLRHQHSSLSPHPSNGDGSSLTGSTVLLALQKAATSKKKNKKKNGRRSERGQEEIVAQEEEAELDYRNVRPINVKREWKERIDELEMRVQELKSRYLD